MGRHSFIRLRFHIAHDFVGERVQNRNECLDLRALILTEDDKSWGSDETKERVWAARANKLRKRNEEIMWGNYWEVGILLVRSVRHIQG